MDENQQNTDLGTGFESGNPVIIGEEGMQKIFNAEVLCRSLLMLAAAFAVAMLAAANTSREKSPLSFNIFFFFFITGIVWELYFLIDALIQRRQAALCGIMFMAYAYLNGVVYSVCAEDALTVSLIFGTMAILCFGLAIYGILSRKSITGFKTGVFLFAAGTVLGIIFNVFLFKRSIYDVGTVQCVIITLILVGITIYDLNRLEGDINLITDMKVKTLAYYTGIQMGLDYYKLIFLFLLEITECKRR